MNSPHRSQRPPRGLTVTSLTAITLAACLGAQVAHPLPKGIARAELPPIIIDGQFKDWRKVPTTDPKGWQVALAENSEFLYVHFRLPEETLVQAAGSDVVLLLDTDDDASTGRSVFGIGADIEWNFGSRRGTLRKGGSERPASPAQLGLVVAPTVSTRQVELALALATLPGTGRVARGREQRIRGALATPEKVLEPEQELVRFTYRLGSWASPEIPPVDLGRESADDLRVINYNIEHDGLFEKSREKAYKRVLRALAPDIVGFQEMWAHSASDAGVLFDQWIPLPGGQRWQTAAKGTDVAVASRYPILSSWLITQDADAHLIDPRPTFGSRLLVIVVSLKCCDDLDGKRKRQIDSILAFWRDAITPGGDVTLPDGTPIVMIGDMNLVGDASELRALRDGIPFNPATGPAFGPDWDGTALTDLRPLHADLPMAYTWRKDGNTGGFVPGRLDFIFFTDSVLDARRRFALQTASMSRKRLRTYGLRRRDTTVASDHLPVVADFVLRPPGR